jgi:TonB-dependent SusC/RagA subfamily outer membrane receptor
MNRAFPRSTLALVALVATAAACSHSGNTPKTRSTTTAPTVTSDDVERASAGGQPIEKALEGRISGVTVTRTGDGISVRVRGATSFNMDDQPLYIVDGQPVAVGPSGSLSGISPNDIASIKVLKDATDLTMYGSRGANGVVVITTKRPAKPNQ